METLLMKATLEKAQILKWVILFVGLHDSFLIVKPVTTTPGPFQEPKSHLTAELF